MCVLIKQYDMVETWHEEDDKIYTVKYFNQNTLSRRAYYENWLDEDNIKMDPKGTEHEGVVRIRFAPSITKDVI